METLLHKLQRLITHNLRQGQADLELMQGGLIVGHVISPEFSGRTFASRRNIIKKKVIDQLKPTEQKRVSTLLTYTPAEWSVPLDSTEPQ